MSRFPEPPELPPENHTAGRLAMRYEDVSQVGRVMLSAVPAAGAAVWRNLLVDHPMQQSIRKGVVPILSRLAIEMGEGPFPVRREFEVEGCYQLAHTLNDRGERERIIMNLWAELWCKKGRTNGPPPPGRGERVRVGRFYAEHVFTRPFGPREKRKVYELPYDGEHYFPPTQHRWRPFESIIDPGDAELLAERMVPDACVTYFGLDHTDSNQHVNSLVYPGLFVDASLRQLAMAGERGSLQARYLEIGFRKPCFAGDGVRVFCQPIRQAGEISAVGVIVPEDDVEDEGNVPDLRPNCYARVDFARFDADMLDIHR